MIKIYSNLVVLRGSTVNTDTSLYMFLNCDIWAGPVRSKHDPFMFRPVEI